MDIDRVSRTVVRRILHPPTIRGRLARILLFSLTLVFVLLADIVSGVVGRYLDAGATVHSVALASAVRTLVHEAQGERGLTNGLLGGDERFASALGSQRARTDRALQAVDRALADYDVPAEGDVRAAVAKLAGLPAVRDGVDGRRADRRATFQFYVAGIDALNRVNFVDQAHDAELRRTLQTQYVLALTKEQTAQERDYLAGIFAAGRFEGGEFAHFTVIMAAKQASSAALQVESAEEYRTRFTGVVGSEQALAAEASERVAADSSAGPLIRPVDAEAWWGQTTSLIDNERGIQETMGADVKSRAEALQHRAAVDLAVYLGTALLAAGIEVWLVIGCMRSIIRPLSILSDEADDVATHRLPDSVAAWSAAEVTEPEPPAPVRVPSEAGVEIASVARALDRVQHTAFELASEQALLRRNTTESLANLGRRNQNLLRRQLGFISEFEREELDPSTLAKLFELDHLATRMRRNAESLLVLVGERSVRPWTEPVALEDVIHAGLSEVEAYRRVVLRRVDDTLIVGTAVAELAHMLAELIENGLAFSPPEVEVEIHGRSTGGHYALAIVDHGVGMPEDQLAMANARLAGAESFLVPPTRFLGHYVVGRLARRLGIEVELSVSPLGGISARLTLPGELLVEPSDPARDPDSPACEQSLDDTGPDLAAAEPPAAADSAVTAANEPRRTRNGLVKRQPRRVDRAAPPRSDVVPDTSEPAPARRPDEVRTRLTAFRSGHQRGSGEHGQVGGGGERR